MHCNLGSDTKLVDLLLRSSDLVKHSRQTVRGRRFLLSSTRGMLRDEDMPAENKGEEEMLADMKKGP